MKQKPEKTLKKRAFLQAFGVTANVKWAAEAAKIDRQEHWRWLKVDQAYKEAFETVEDEVAQALENEAIRRAYEGIKRPVLYKGTPVKVGRRILYQHEFSDTLLLALLKRFRPAQYREHIAAEVSGSINLVERLTAANARLIAMRRDDDDTGTG